jgi:hypothetical protein
MPTLSSRKFNIGDRVRVTNLSEATHPKWAAELGYVNTTISVGSTGIVKAYVNKPWPVDVEHEDGTIYPYSETELELAE